MYLGRNPAVGTQRMLDSIESQFNGVLTTFDLRYGGVPTYPTLSASLIVSLGGVLQEPGSAYYVSSDKIVFTEPPQTGFDCWILLYSQYGTGVGAAQQGLLGAETLTLTGELRGPSNFVIDPAAIGNNTGTVEIKGNLTVQGTTTTVNSTTTTVNQISLGDNDKALFGDGNDLQIYHTGSNSYIKHIGTGNLYTDVGAADYYQITNSESETIASFQADGAVELYHNGGKKFETTTLGTLTTGAIGVVNPDYYSATYPWYLRQDALQGYFSINYYSNTDDFVIRDNNNVGIGTTNPIQKLHVVGSTLLSNNNYHYGFSSAGSQTSLIGITSSNNVIIGQNNVNHANTIVYGGTGTIQLSTGGDERLRVTSTGNVGIGNSAPSTRLHVSSSISSLPSPDDLTSSVGYFSNTYSNTTNGTNAYTVLRLQRAGEAGVTYPSTADFSIARYEASGTSSRTRLDIRLGHQATNTTDTAVMSLLSSGAVGIGTTNPLNKLHLYGTGSNYIYNEISDSGNAGLRLKNSAGEWYVFTDGLGKLSFYNGSTAQISAIINSVGNVGIGTTNPLSKLHLSNAGAEGLEIYIANAANVNAIQHYNRSSSAYVTHRNIALAHRFEISGIEKVCINSSGNVGIGITNPTELLSLQASTGTTFGVSLTPFGWNSARHRFTVPISGNTSMLSWNYNGSVVDSSLYATSAIFVQNGVISLATGTFNAAPTDRLVVNSIGNVGIGTTNPGNKLHIYSASGTSRIQIDSGSNNSFIGFDGSTTDLQLASSTSIKFQTGAAYAQRACIDSVGNVGIGTTNPVSILDIASGSFQSVRTYLSSITDTFHQYRGTPDGVGYEHARVYSGRDSTSFSYGSYLAFYTEGKNSGTTDTSLERLRISPNGNVGIGTTNPTFILDAVGSSNAIIRVKGGSATNEGGAFYVQTAASATTLTAYGDTARILGGTPDQSATIFTSGIPLYFYVNSNYRMAISSAGNVGIGITNPDYKLQVNGSSIGLGTNGGSFTQRILNGGTGDFTIEMDTTERVRITGTGGNLLPGADASQNLGSTTKRWANVYTTDLQLSNEGSANDIDGTWGAYTIQEGEDALYLINRRSGKKFKFVLEEIT